MALRLSEIEQYWIKTAEKKKCLLELAHARKKIDVTKIFVDGRMHQYSVNYYGKWDGVVGMPANNVN